MLGRGGSVESARSGTGRAWAASALVLNLQHESLSSVPRTPRVIMGTADAEEFFRGDLLVPGRAGVNYLEPL